MAKKANPKDPAKDTKVKAAKPPKEKKVSALDAAAQVLANADEPMNCVQLIEAMSKAGLWPSSNGSTPNATIPPPVICAKSQYWFTSQVEDSPNTPSWWRATPS